MRYLLDTNVVVRAVNRDDALYPVVSTALHLLSSRGDDLIIVPQVIYEFWALATRPAAVNGLGWPTSRVQAVATDIIRSWTFLQDDSSLFWRWLELVTTHDVKGKQVHDARLAAAAQAHGVDHLLTLNTPDFRRFGVPSLYPSDVIA